MSEELAPEGRIPEVLEFVVPGALAGERVDRAVSLLTGRSRSEVAEVVEAGGVSVSGTRIVTRSTRVREGESLRVELGHHEVAPLVTERSTTVAYELVYEDDELLVINKPAGVVVHPGAGHRDDTLIAALVASFPELERLEGQQVDRPGVVHRLDKDTSGLLVVARTTSSFESLSAQLKDRVMGREYIALVLGEPSAPSGVIDAPIGRSTRDATRMAVLAGGRHAITHYELVRQFHEPFAAALLNVRLETGRTHQIRVHLSAIGLPIAGDVRYGARRPALVARPFLHAARLSFSHPRTGDELSFEVPLPNDLFEVLAQLS